MAISIFSVKLIPLIKENTYGDSIDITDFVIDNGIGSIKEQIDSGEYDIGLYTYASISLKLANFDGRFNSEAQSGTLFCYSRDRAKVEIIFINEKEDPEKIVFRGIINDEGTKQDFNESTITIKVLSQDSILRKTSVSGGLLDNGMTFSIAIKTLLNRPSITNVLIYNDAKINVGLDLIIDDVTAFNDKDSRVVLEELLNASLSVFYVDDSNTMVVSSRTVTNIPPLDLFGGGDLLDRNNAIIINKYNDGLQRTFNTITINTQTSIDQIFIDRYGTRIKQIDFDFITNLATASEIADFILIEFRNPKREMELTTTVDTIKDLRQLDPITVSWQKLYQKWEGINRIPVAGVAIAGEDLVPYSAGGITINENIIWKVTGITKNPNTFLTKIRLREV